MGFQVSSMVVGTNQTKAVFTFGGQSIKWIPQKQWQLAADTHKKDLQGLSPFSRDSNSLRATSMQGWHITIPVNPCKQYGANL